jgi:hypothetical protein
MTEQQPGKVKWWRQPPVYALIAVVIVVAALFGYTQGWTGFNEYTKPSELTVPAKTLWDWFQLLIVPLLLAVAAVIINSTVQRAEHERAEQQARTEREISEDRLREQTLQTYLDRMTELLLDRGLGKPDAPEELKTVARARTLTVLRRLDPPRKGLLMRFLQDARLTVGKTAICLSGADLSGADLTVADLTGVFQARLDAEDTNLAEATLMLTNLAGTCLVGARLNGAYLNTTDFTKARLQNAKLNKVFGMDPIFIDAKLNKADLTGAILVDANFAGADLTDAILTDAVLPWANLSGATVTAEQLAATKSLEGATMPDGTKHD